MIYSVWDQGRGSYRLYDAPGDAGVHAPGPRHLGSSVLGLSPDEAAWPLPAGAELVGEAKLPQGQIAVQSARGALGFIPTDLVSSNTLLFGVAGILAYWYLKKG